MGKPVIHISNFQLGKLRGAEAASPIEIVEALRRIYMLLHNH